MSAFPTLPANLPPSSREHTRSGDVIHRRNSRPPDQQCRLPRPLLSLAPTQTHAQKRLHILVETEPFFPPHPGLLIASIPAYKPGPEPLPDYPATLPPVHRRILITDRAVAAAGYRRGIRCAKDVARCTQRDCTDSSTADPKVARASLTDTYSFSLSCRNVGRCRLSEARTGKCGPTASSVSNILHPLPEERRGDGGGDGV